MDHVGQLQIGAVAAAGKSPPALRAAEDLRDGGPRRGAGWGAGRGAGRGAGPGVLVELPAHPGVREPAPEDVAVAVAAEVVVVVAVVEQRLPLVRKDPDSQVLDQHPAPAPHGTPARVHGARGAGRVAVAAGGPLPRPAVQEVPHGRPVLRLLVLAPQLDHALPAEVVPAGDGHGVLEVIQADGAHGLLPEGLHRAGRPVGGRHRRARGSCGSWDREGLAALPSSTVRGPGTGPGRSGAGSTKASLPCEERESPGLAAL